MRRTVLQFIVLSVALFATSAGAIAEDDARTNARTAGVISLLSDEIEIYRFGKWFDGYSYEHVLTGANFDALAEQAIERRLGTARPGIAVQRIDILKDDVIRQSNRGLLALYNADVSDIRDAIRPWAAAHGVDVIVILRQLNQAVPIQAPQSNFRGLGLYASFSVEIPVPVASVGVVVWDGKTLEHIAESEIFLVGFPDATYSTENKMRINLEEPRRERLVSDLRQLVQAAVPPLLSRVGF